MPATAPTWLPFAALNLRRNPFGEFTYDERARAAVVDVERWASWLVGGSRRALQITGDCGRGKTTHLVALHAQLAGSAYVHLPEDGPLPSIPEADPLLIDEAQRLPWFRRRRVFARGATLVLGTHRDLSRPLVRAGYNVQTIAAAADTNPISVRAIMNRRIEMSRLSTGPVPELTLADCEHLVARFGNDVRTMEHFLYEQCQRAIGNIRAGNKHGQEVRLID